MLYVKFERKYDIMRKIKIILLFITLSILICFLTSCYQLESKNIAEYQSFYAEMDKRESFIYELFPNLKEQNSIKGMYIYYDDKDLIDSCYAVYLDCEYTEEMYNTEIARLSELSDYEDLVIKNSNSFNYNSFVYTDILYSNSYVDSGTARYDYALFDKSRFKIVYVSIFEDELNGKSSNIPEEYLPIELIEARGDKR